VKIVDEPESSAAAKGGATRSKQSAQIRLPRAELERVWTPEHLERLARTYWSYLTRISLGLMRVCYSETSREVVLLRKPLVLLRFRAPEYETSAEGGAVTWQIERGLLVAPAGRDDGYLRISVHRDLEADDASDEVTVTVSSEVANFYPTIAGWGWFARVGATVYRVTQLRIHVIVTHGFLRSLARLELEPSVVGALAAAAGRDRDDPGA